MMENAAVLPTNGDLFGDLPTLSRPRRSGMDAPCAVVRRPIEPASVLAEFYPPDAVARFEAAFAADDFVALAKVFDQQSWLSKERDEVDDAQLGFLDPVSWSDEEIRELRGVLLVDALEDLAKALVFDRVSIVDRIAWILADDPDHPFGFANCAEACGFDAERLRSEVVATLRHMGVWSPGQPVHV
ncbi:MAG: hypothetical protein EA356_00115 [Geminicoccaceae bacterium]|nr:MAG: hypothetical protein EA356_00115 [Geminicoccaceae bacterium]